MGRYTDWTEATSNSHRAIYEVGTIIQYLTIPQRKLLLTQARCQVLPVKTSALYIRNVATYHSQIHYPVKTTYASHHRLWDLAMTLDFFMTPIFSGLLSVMLRCAPHTHVESIYDEIASGKDKEVTAAITPFHGPVFDYTCILSPRKSDRVFPLTPLFNEIPSRANVAEDTHMALLRSKVCLLYVL